jgi:hypothetical protein
MQGRSPPPHPAPAGHPPCRHTLHLRGKLPLALPLALLTLLPCPTALADRQVGLEMGERLPFSRAQLVEAVVLRLPLEQGAGAALVRVGVRGVGRDTVVVELLGRGIRRSVPLLGARGVPAARRVALVIYDLVRDELLLPIPVFPAASRPASHAVDSPAVRPAASRPASPIRARPPRAALTEHPPGGPPRLLLGLLAVAGAGTNGDRATISTTVEASLRLVPALRALLSLGPAFVPPATVNDLSLSLVALPIRVGLAWFPRAGALELRAQVLAQPYWVYGSGGGEQVSHRGLLGGAGVAALYHLRLAWRLWLLLGGGSDVFFNRAELRAHGAPALATERVAFWGGAALAVGLGR